MRLNAGDPRGCALCALCVRYCRPWRAFGAWSARLRRADCARYARPQSVGDRRRSAEYAGGSIPPAGAFRSIYAGHSKLISWTRHNVLKSRSMVGTTFCNLPRKSREHLRRTITALFCRSAPANACQML